MTAEARTSLRSLRDDVRLKAHLAGMELRDAWERLEPQVERAIGNVVINPESVVQDLTRRLTELQRRFALGCSGHPAVRTEED